MSHSDEFYKEKYREVQQYALDNGGTMYRNIGEFINDYNDLQSAGEKNIIRTLKYYTKYETGYKTALAEYRKQKEFGGDMSFKELKNISTIEFAEKHREEIKAYYRKLRADGKTAAAAISTIGVEIFGSGE